MIGRRVRFAAGHFRFFPLSPAFPLMLAVKLKLIIFMYPNNIGEIVPILLDCWPQTVYIFYSLPNPR